MLAPGSLALLMVAVTLGAVANARSRRLARAARIWIAAWVSLYVLLSIPAVSQLLYSGLASRTRVFTIDAAPGAEAVVLLSGDAGRYQLGGEAVSLSQVSTTLRVLEAARVYRLLGSPLVVLTGAGPAGPASPAVESMRAELLAAGVPASRVVIETDSRDTHQSAVASRSLLAARGIRRAVLVTSAQHLPRSMRAFRAAGLDVAGAPAPLAGGLRRGWRAIVPDTSALAVSEACLHEYVGLVYYALRGWS